MVAWMNGRGQLGRRVAVRVFVLHLSRGFTGQARAIHRVVFFAAKSTPAMVCGDSVKIDPHMDAGQKVWESPPA